MSEVNRKKRRRVIHVSIRPKSQKNSQKTQSQNKSFVSDTIHQKNNTASQNEENFHDQLDSIHPSISANLNQKYISQRSTNISKPSTASNEQSRSILGFSSRISPSEQGILPISKTKSNNRNCNRIIPSFEISGVLEKQKNSIPINMNFKKKRKRKYCGLPLWLLLLLVGFVLALMVIITAVIVVLLTISKEKSSSTSTSTVTTTSSMSMTSTSTTTTTSTTASTTTTFYTCSNFTVKPNWDYSGNDVTNNGSQTFASCCAWCLTLPVCVAFTFNPWNTCLIKNSTGSGGVSYPNSIGAAR